MSDRLEYADMQVGNFAQIRSFNAKCTTKPLAVPQSISYTPRYTLDLRSALSIISAGALLEYFLIQQTCVSFFSPPMTERLLTLNGCRVSWAYDQIPA